MRDTNSGKMNMEFVIKDLVKRYGMTDEEVKQTLSPEYDIIQRGNHHTVDVSLHGEIYAIDEKLVNLIKLINKYDMNTISTCQHNWFGWACITFHIEGYISFVNKILEKAREKYQGDMNKIYELNVFNRFQFNTMFDNARTKSISDSKRIYTKCLLFDEEYGFSFEVSINLLQSEISQLESELSELFN